MKKQFDIKKLLLLNMPYILMGLFATNFGEGWRMAVGADASAKMLSFFSTLPVALASWWPSLHPLDLLVGLCCGAGLRLAVYLKSKNAKKYRHGMEYGSARWGTHEDTQKLIEQGATTFYLGGYGAFDSLAASVLREQKKQYPQIELVLVLAYLNTGRNTSGYDSTVYPPLETVPRRFAISHRNRWMVESADVVVAYVLHDWGGAATTLRCAKQKKKQIISYRDEMGS